VLVCLGATAAQALLGRQFRVTRDRGKPLESDLAEHVLATVHPSSILRDPETRDYEYAELVKDLKPSVDPDVPGSRARARAGAVVNPRRRRDGPPVEAAHLQRSSHLRALVLSRRRRRSCRRPQACRMAAAGSLRAPARE
jgi:hypothetical protein